jgi:hypothetical protein
MRRNLIAFAVGALMALAVVIATRGADHAATAPVRSGTPATTVPHTAAATTRRREARRRRGRTTHEPAATTTQRSAGGP